MRRKVSETTKTYYRPNGQAPGASPKSDQVGDSLAERFEFVIDQQDGAGYELETWQVASCSTDEVLTETIIAVFKERPT